MARQQGWFALILALAIAAGSLLFSWNTPETPLGQRLGLDLRGGSQLTLQVLPAGSVKVVQKEQLDAVKEVLDRRINGLGVAESTLQTVGDNQLVLQLPGEQDPTRAATVLGSTALLEFRAQKPGTEQRMQELLGLKRQATTLLESLRAPAAEAKQADRDQLEADLSRLNTDIINLYEPAQLTGKDLVTAGRQQQQSGSSWEVTLSFNKQGGTALPSSPSRSPAADGCWASCWMAAPSVRPAWAPSSKPLASVVVRPASLAISVQMRPAIWRFSCAVAPCPCR